MENENQSLLRNICILAHVDHGKTTIADCLLASNGIISKRQAGKLRFMDSLEAEQERGITMKSSLVALKYLNHSESNLYTINLIDSPGHVDFSSEVSTAVRLCDGALLVVDVVEGVCPQTRTVMRQAWEEGIRLVLVLNKIDRLILELKLDPGQAYEHLQRVIEQVNSVVAELNASETFRTENIVNENAENVEKNTFCWSANIRDESLNSSSIYFNSTLFSEGIIFASAYDNWGFRTCDFAKVWAEKLNLPQNILSKALWGDYYLASNPKIVPEGPQKIIKKGASEKGKTPLFVQCILNQIWNIYDTLVTKKEYDKVNKMAEVLNVAVNKRELKNCDFRGTLKAFMSAWLPLGEACMKSVITACPNPLTAIDFKRALHILYGDQLNIAISDSLNTQEPFSPILKHIQNCNSSEDSFVAFVSKVFWFPKSRLVIQADTKITPEDDQDQIKSPLTMNNPFESTEFVALTRIFSGSAYAGRKVFVLGPKFDSSRIPKSIFDSDPNDLPPGQVYAKTSEEDDIFLDNVSSTMKPTLAPNEVHKSSNLPVDIALMPRSKNDSFSDSSQSPGSVNSVGLNFSSNDRVPIRHLYVAEITSIVKFLAGQQDIKKVDRDQKVGSGQIVGLLGSDLITALPKSGLIISNLRILEKKPLNSEDPLQNMINQIGILPLAGLSVNLSPPVISVAIEPAFSTGNDDILRFERGLRLLERSDPCVEVTVSSKGEYFVHAMGEIHLQKCLDDLTKFFAPNLQVHISPFVVPFRETITESADPLPENIDVSLLTPDNEDYIMKCLREKKETSQLKSVQQSFVSLPMGFIQVPQCKKKTRIYIHVTAHPMPQKLLQWIYKQRKSTFTALVKSSKVKNEKWNQLNEKFKNELKAILEELERDGEEVNRNSYSNTTDDVIPKLPWKRLVHQFLSFGPELIGLNMLFSCIKRSNIHLENCWGCPIPTFENGITFEDYLKQENRSHSSHSRAILRGFQTFTSNGPICSEPLQGTIFILEDIFAQEIKYLESEEENPSDIQFELDEEIKENDQLPVDESEKSMMNDEIDLKAKRKEKIKKLALVSWMDEDLDDLNEDWDDVDIIEENTGPALNHRIRQRKRRESLQSTNSNEDDNQNLDGLAENMQNLHFNKEHFEGNTDKIWCYYSTLDNFDWLSDISPGMLTPGMTRACTIGFQICSSQRLLLAVYDLQLQARADVLGKMYTELRRRHATIVNEEISEGEHAFIIHAKIPVIESFGLTNDLRKKTSGYISLPQLTFGGWSLLDIDPTEKDSNGDVALGEEHLNIRDSYEKALAYAHCLMNKHNTELKAPQEETIEGDELENNAQLKRIKNYIRSVRKRKGLPVYEQIVVHADKQRTLKKNK